MLRLVFILISGCNCRNVYIIQTGYLVIPGKGTVRNFHEDIFISLLSHGYLKKNNRLALIVQLVCCTVGLLSPFKKTIRDCHATHLYRL